MKPTRKLLVALVFAMAASASTFVGNASADPIIVQPAPARQVVPAEQFHMGTSAAPDGHTVSINSVCLLRDGKPWTPMMGEFHYSRYPQSQWAEELLKMKAGGVEIVATYIFWNHHEEAEGKWDWTGDRDLKHFITLCKELGLYAVVRIGPWDHGEVRNGGIPDWLLTKGYKLRSDDEGYLAEVGKLYGQISEQLRGLLWKDGGPVIGLQVENEYRGPAGHLLRLKEIALKAGLDVPLYTRTGWPELRPPPAFGELIPMYGGYAEGFWDKVLTPMPGQYWQAFIFTQMRDTMETPAQVDARYPFLTCELGGGMMTSYHRRIRVDSRDAAAVELVKIGLGSNLAGFYMYHGGTNPQGELSTLNENQSTKMTNDNDMPVKSYDFQTALGEFGQIRGQYHLLRRMGLFLHDWGGVLAPMEPVISTAIPREKTDTTTLRWSVRSDGAAGFIFINNYQRLQPMPAKEGVQFQLRLAGGNLSVPQSPIKVPADSFFFWPFNVDVGGVKLIYATAQPMCVLEASNTQYSFFAETPGIPAEFVFDGAETLLDSSNGSATTAEGRIVVKDVKPGTGAAIVLKTAGGKKSVIVLLDEPTSLTCWKANLAGRDRVFITRAGLTVNGDKLQLQAADPTDMKVSILPAPTVLALSGFQKSESDDGVFHQYTAAVPEPQAISATVEQIQAAGPGRKIEIASKRGGVAQAPTDEDFAAAAVCRIHLPQGIDPKRNLLLRVHYFGDVARIYLDGNLLDDNFYNGKSFDLGLGRYAPAIYQRELLVKILPLQKDAPIYVPKEAMPNFGSETSTVGLDTCDIIETLEANFTAK